MLFCSFVVFRGWTKIIPSKTDPINFYWPVWFYWKFPSYDTPFRLIQRYISVFNLTDNYISESVTYLFIVLLESGQILPGFWEFTLLHTFTDVPVYESAFGVHKIELVVETSPSFGDSRGVTQHANGALHLSQIAARYYRRWLVINTDLKFKKKMLKTVNL